MRYVYLDPEMLIKTPQFEFITRFLKSTGRDQVGWHYVIDLTWIYLQVMNLPTSYRILDVGGGNGATQFLLAELGFNVTNIDLVLNKPASNICKRYHMNFEELDSYQRTSYVNHLDKNYSMIRSQRKSRGIVSSSKVYQYLLIQKYKRIYNQWRANNEINNKVGSLIWKQANLCHLPEIASDYFDAVVSLSAIEHIPVNSLPKAWAEITRISKPKAVFAITTSATEQHTTWFHKPSQGNCFSAHDLKKLFGAQPDDINPLASEMLEKYTDCEYLKKNLAAFYSMSGENGMPWGEWSPKYFPVGLI